MADLFNFLFKELLEAKKIYFRFVFGGIIFILFGYVYVIEPYFSYQNQKKQLENILNYQLKEVKKLEEKINKLKKTVDLSVLSYEELENRLDIFPYELAGAIIDFRNYFSSEKREKPQKDLTEEEYEYFKNFSNIKEAVRWYTDNWYIRIFNIAKDEIIEPISKTSTEIGLSTKKLEDLYRSTFESFEKKYKSYDENLWKDYNQIVENKSIVAEKISSTLKQTIKEFLVEIKNYLDTFRDYLKKENIKVEKLKDKINQINKSEEDLKNKLNIIDSPIGKLPVDLVDFIRTFPFILSLISFFIYLQYKKIQNLIEYTISHSDTKEKLFKVRYTSEHYLLKKQFLLLVFILFFLIYLRVIYLIMIEGDLFRMVTGEVNRSELALYSVFYLSGFLIFLLLISKIFSMKGALKPPKNYKDLTQFRTSS